MPHTVSAIVEHVLELRRLVWASPGAQERYEAAVLLIDLYERVLSDLGVLEFDEEVEQ